VEGGGGAGGLLVFWAKTDVLNTSPIKQNNMALYHDRFRFIFPDTKKELPAGTVVKRDP
jgi:hypothetical protein